MVRRIFLWSPELVAGQSNGNRQRVGGDGRPREGLYSWLPFKRCRIARHPQCIAAARRGFVGTSYGALLCRAGDGRHNAEASGTFAVERGTHSEMLLHHATAWRS